MQCHDALVRNSRVDKQLLLDRLKRRLREQKGRIGIFWSVG